MLTSFTTGHPQGINHKKTPTMIVGVFVIYRMVVQRKETYSSSLLPKPAFSSSARLAEASSALT